MMAKKYKNGKVLLDSYDAGIAAMFRRHDYIVDIYSPGMSPSINKYAHIVYTGGYDINPKLYKSDVHPKTSFNERRDRRSDKVWDSQVSRHGNIGICRGAQFLNVKNGGSLFQHVTEHTSPHDVYVLPAQKNMRVSSTHHQQMILPESGELIAYAQQKGARHELSSYLNVMLPEDYMEVEIAYLPTTDSLVIQGHPEHHGFEEFEALTFDLIDFYLKKKEL